MKNDGELISGFLNGSAEDFEELVRRYEREVYCTALHMVGNREEARDITQEAFLRVLKGLRELKDQMRFRPWLLSITVNLARDHLRKRSFGSREDDFAEGTFGGCADEAFQRLSRLQEREELLNLLFLLPPRQRVAVVLRIYNELPFKEVAHIMGCEVATARSLFWAGIREMRRRLGERDEV